MTVSEQENTTQEPTPEQGEKGRKSFGNTIVLFIVFFIIFTALVTGVAFFADKLKGKPKDKMTEEMQKEDVTNPESGKQEAYVMDEKGNVAKQSGEAENAPEKKADEPVLAAPPAEPVKAEEPVKDPEPVKEAVKEAVKTPAKPMEAPKAEVKKEAEKPKAEVVKTPVKMDTQKTVQKTAEKPVEKPAEKPVVKTAEKPAEKPAAKAVEKTVEKTGVKKETPKTEVKETVKASDTVTPVLPGDYLVQLASFKSLELAEEEYRRLRSKISDLQLVKVDLGEEKGIWYRLRCSTGLSKESAKARAAQIEASTGYKPDIVKK